MRLRLLFIILLSFTCISVSFASDKEAEESSDIKPLSKEDIFYELGLFADAITMINSNYVEEVEPKAMVYGALEGMLPSLDSHSSFLTPEEFKEIQSDAMGEFGGLGIKVTVRDGILIVVSPLADTPAYKAGVLPGDRIIGIDGESTKDFTLDDVVKKLRGTPGTSVTLTIMRDNEDRLKEFKIKRALIKIKSIKDALIIEDGIGYIRIAEFQVRTAPDLDKAVRRLLKKKMKALILDVRNNPGGLLDSAVLVSEKFLKKGDVIVSTKARIKQQNMIFKSEAFRPYLDFPIAVMINRGSASASEIVAGALRDNKRAIIVGQKSFGKGSVQTVIPMNDGSALRLTTSFYYMPSGDIIHEKGVMPDIEVISEVEISDEDAEERKEKKRSNLKKLREDKQIVSAIEILKDKERYQSIINKNE